MWLNDALNLKYTEVLFWEIKNIFMIGSGSVTALFYTLLMVSVVDGFSWSVIINSTMGFLDSENISIYGILLFTLCVVILWSVFEGEEKIQQVFFKYFTPRSSFFCCGGIISAISVKFRKRNLIEV